MRKLARGPALAFAAGAVVGFIAASGVGIGLRQLSDDNAGGHRALCDAAQRWRDAMEAFEVTSNVADRATPEGRDALGDDFKALANIQLPIRSDLNSGDRELLDALVSTTDATERWWVDLFQYYSASARSLPTAERLELTSAHLDLLTTMNKSLRDTNPVLSGRCGVRPIELFKEGE